MRIISVGDLVLDYYYKNDKLIGVNGGMTSHNIIANLAIMGFNTSVIGNCGNDSAGVLAMKSLSDIGVNVNNITTINKATRCFHVSYFDTNNKVEFTSKKRCPFCNLKKWYENSELKINLIKKQIQQEDVLVFDNLNVINQNLISQTNNVKMLDLGQYYELENYSKKEIQNILTENFDIINLNERVEKYLLKRFKLSSLDLIYSFLKPKLLIVTRGTNGADFIFERNFFHFDLLKKATEIDPTGAGDAFFSVYIGNYVKNNFHINEEFLYNSFLEATKLTSKVVKKLGARGHINNLYKIKKINQDVCACSDFVLKTRKQIKRCNININNMEKRVLNALDSNASTLLKNLDFKNLKNPIFVGTGGSYASAYFAAVTLNNLFGINSLALYPRDVFYRNNISVDKVFLFSYSGTTADILLGVSSLENKKKLVITKGEIRKIVKKTKISKNNIISYRTSSNKGKERGFLAFEGAVAPASLFLNIYFNNVFETKEFIKDSIVYWKNYFYEYFKINKKNLKAILKKGNIFNVFTGDNTKTASYDLESKIIESELFNVLIHEKKNFSHGRFINYENVSDKISIYFKQKSTSDYEKLLLNYLKTGNNIIIESRYDDILCEFDLLIASQFLIYYISNLLNIDISKPKYSEEAMKIYFYKGDF